MTDTCFVIMPFGGYFDAYYKEVYVPAIEDAGLIPKRADDLYKSGVIVNDIWELTKKSKIILADITGRNPNVLYELGLAHAIAKPVVQITESIEDIPFDLRSLRTIQYNKELPNWGEKLKEDIKNGLNETLDSPSNSVLPTFLYSENSTDKISVSEKDLLELRHEINTLKGEMNRQSEVIRNQERNLGLFRGNNPFVVTPHSAKSMQEQLREINRNNKAIGIDDDEIY